MKNGKFNGVKSKTDIYDKDYQTDCEFYTDVLLKNGVPKSAIIGENKSGHTHDNAFFLRKTADEHGLNIKSAIIVCKSFHARCCLMFTSLLFQTWSYLFARSIVTVSQEKTGLPQDTELTACSVNFPFTVISL